MILEFKHPMLKITHYWTWMKPWRICGYQTFGSRASEGFELTQVSKIKLLLNYLQVVIYRIGKVLQQLYRALWLLLCIHLIVKNVQYNSVQVSSNMLIRIKIRFFPSFLNGTWKMFMHKTQPIQDWKWIQCMHNFPIKTKNEEKRRMNLFIRRDGLHCLTCLLSSTSTISATLNWILTLVGKLGGIALL